MRKLATLFTFGAALLIGAAPIVSSAGLPAGPQASSSTSSSTASKKKKTATSASSKSSKSSKSKKRSKGVRAQTAPTPDRIKEIQGALQKDGSYEGEPNGKWDAATIDAMKKYQDKNGISPTGKIDAQTLNKLGLGSETAGKGAPVTPATPAPTPISTPTPAGQGTPTAATSATDPK